MPFAKLSDLIRGQSHKRGLARQVEAAMILEYFNQAVATHFDAEARESMRALYLKDAVIVVAVLSPILAQELRLREHLIVQSVNAKAGQHVVRGIRYLS